MPLIAVGAFSQGVSRMLCGSLTGALCLTEVKWTQALQLMTDYAAMNTYAVSVVGVNYMTSISVAAYTEPNGGEGQAASEDARKSSLTEGHGRAPRASTVSQSAAISITLLTSIAFWRAENMLRMHIVAKIILHAEIGKNLRYLYVAVEKCITSAEMSIICFYSIHDRKCYD
ncbi:hypothetical protein OBBRIDRAFT_808371 [Obba rivulosa]|uniref:Uncharacterized protein n=1 Tax=Obba rivulosa TaxID=1052685 RepID=A0A8E2AGW7_9APHY|nr:hypothetical protein OBBRIDRAFT_808371 [Obba rivulosa]